MADVSDVANTLVQIISALLYPNGPSNPSLTGDDSRTFYGWPVPAQLDKDLKAQRSQISVFPRAPEHNATRYLLEWDPVSSNTATLTLAQAGQTVTVGGSVPATSANNPQHLTILVDGQAFSYLALSTDTLTSIAAALTALVKAVDPSASSSGPVITFSNAARIQAVRVGVTASSGQEVRRQERVFQVTVWAPTPSARDRLAQAIDLWLANPVNTFIQTPDTSACRLRYHSSVVRDELLKDLVYRRDLLYLIEYGTNLTRTDAQVTATQLNIYSEPAGTEIATEYD